MFFVHQMLEAATASKDSKVKSWAERAYAILEGQASYDDSWTKEDTVKLDRVRIIRDSLDAVCETLKTLGTGAIYELNEWVDPSLEGQLDLVYDTLDALCQVKLLLKSQLDYIVKYANLNFKTDLSGVIRDYVSTCLMSDEEHLKQFINLEWETEIRRTSL